MTAIINDIILVATGGKSKLDIVADDINVVNNTLVDIIFTSNRFLFSPFNAFTHALLLSDTRIFSCSAIFEYVNSFVAASGICVLTL